MKKRFFVLLFLLLILSLLNALSHEGEEEYFLDPSSIYPLTQMQAVTYGSIIFAFLALFVLLFHKKMTDSHKKIAYILLASVIAAVTLYLIVTTLHLNITSETKGPVHWHADFEVWVCDEEVIIAEPKGLSNKQGVDLMHAHNDKRIHVEGVLLEKKAASLGAFFYAIGGSLLIDGIKIPTNEGLMSYHNGDFCNGKPARLYVFVNGNVLENPPAYTIAPYEKVPPGDRIKFVFTDKPVEEINPHVK